MWVMGKVGRYLAQWGRYLAAQQPRRIRWGQGLEGWGGVEEMVCAMRRMIVSASLSSLGVY